MCEIESKGITARWAAAKQRIILANAKLVKFTSAIHAAIKAECGQVAGETTFAYEGWEIVLGHCGVGNESPWLIYVVMPGHCGQESSRAKMETHWHLTLKQCEDLARVLEGVKPSDIRLAIETKLAED